MFYIGVYRVGKGFGTPSEKSQKAIGFLRNTGTDIPGETNGPL